MMLVVCGWQWHEWNVLMDLIYGWKIDIDWLMECQEKKGMSCGQEYHKNIINDLQIFAI